MKRRPRWQILLLILLLALVGFTPVEPKPPLVPIINRDYLPCAREMIRGAKDYIHILFLEIHEDATTRLLMDELVSSKKRGVEVKVLLENKLSCNEESLFYLKRNGIEARLDSPKKFLHHKLMIVDGKEVILGSTNWSYMSLNHNNETNVRIQDPAITRYYEKYFQLLWEDTTREPRIPPLRTKNVIPLAVKKDYFDEIRSLLGSATKRIHIVMYGVRYYGKDSKYPDSMVNAVFNDLIKAKTKGVEVKVLLERSDYSHILNKFNEEVARYLKENEVEVRFDSPTTITHAKLIIVDDVTLLGSSNWGYGGLKLYLGSNVLLLDPQLTDYYEKYFQRLWTKSGE
jgi:phosphatidylserine/phosphatidylglycerophosphate/cardiolipin synthase-like enzyme